MWQNFKLWFPKEIVKKIKIQIQEKIFATYVFDNGFISRMYKELLKSQ